MKLIVVVVLAAFTFILSPSDTNGQTRQRTQRTRLGSSTTAKPELLTKSWTINGTKRTALVHVPQAETNTRSNTVSTDQTKPPLIFGFHGHGGTARKMVSRYRFHELWPEAVVVYPQGLKTKGKTDPEGNKPGWQNASGLEGDRDLQFFDAMLTSMIEDYDIDPNRVYLSGHSNGAGFSYCLLGARNSKVSAIAVSAGGGRGLRRITEYKPRPVLHIAGRNDTVVPFSSQERTIKALIKLNKCEEKAKPAPANALRYASKDGKADVVFWPHEGTHRYPEKAPELMIRFLKRVK